MPTFKIGDMIQHGVWNSLDPLLVTTNSYVNKRGELVMGKGFARQVSLHFRDHNLAQYFGEQIMLLDAHLKDYYILQHPVTRVCAFQVKRHWRLDAVPDVLWQSVVMLGQWANNEPELTFNLNYPAIGNGGMTVEQVAPYLEWLPDNVHVWRLHDGPSESVVDRPRGQAYPSRDNRL